MPGHKRGRITAASLFFLLSVFAGFTQAGEAPAPWVVGISSLRGVNLSPENRYLVHSIPMLLKESVRAVVTHRFTEEEKSRYRFQLHENALQEARKSIREIRERQESAYFRSPGEYDEELYTVELEKAHAKLALLETQIQAAIAFPGEAKVLIRQGQELGGLLSPPEFSPAEYARKHGLDLLIWGEIEEIQEYLLVRIFGYHTHLAKMAFSYEDAVNVESFSGLLAGLTEEVVLGVRGGDSALVSVSTVPADSTVEINGGWLGRGPVERAPVDPGDIVVRVGSPGYREEIKTFSLEPGEARELIISLSPLEFQEIRLSSLPSGANVYLGAEWMGTTPLILNVHPQQPYLLLKKAGYREQSFLLSSDMPEEMAVPLKKELFDETFWQQRRRDRFYGSLGAFALSLPLPLFLYSFAVDNAYGGLRETSGSQEYNTFTRRTELLYYGYLGTLFVSVTLFLNMTVDLLEYVSRVF